MTAAPTTGQLLQDAFDRAGVVAGFHAVDLATGAEVAHHADVPQVSASVFKVPVLVTLLRLADAGELDLAEQVLVPVTDRAPGPTGLSVFSHPVTLSWQDLARQMIVVSDNAATDVVMERVGTAAIAVAVKELGLSTTAVVEDCRGLFRTVCEDEGLASLDELVGVPTRAQLDGWRAMRPLETNHTTPRDTTRLLAALWDDSAASPESCAIGRAILGQQVWPHRLASGFPEDGIATAGKTGTLPGIRNEVGVVSYADGGRYAVACFTRAHEASAKNYAADAVIGEAARIAVDALRGG